MFRKHEWVMHQRGQLMRVTRDQKQSDEGHVWCEWTDGGYHAEAHHESELQPVPREQWPEGL
jgi:uncharacterized protein YodC (DUF2158 family)